jgi:hypothetical protein
MDQVLQHLGVAGIPAYPLSSFRWIFFNKSKVGTSKAMVRIFNGSNSAMAAQRYCGSRSIMRLWSLAVVGGRNARMTGTMKHREPWEPLGTVGLVSIYAASFTLATLDQRGTKSLNLRSG